MYRLRPPVLHVLGLVVVALVCLHAIQAVVDLGRGDETAFLTFPLAVLTPALAFGFLVRRRGMVSQEGVLMQLGAMLQLVLIIALPAFAVYLTLGFPVVFLVVELFETRLPAALRDPIKRKLLA